MGLDLQWNDQCFYSSTLRIQHLELSGSFTFGSTNLIKNWDTSFIQSATYGTNLASAISGAFQSGLDFKER